MQRFYFNLFDELDVIDEEGRELRDADAARAEAERSAREIACAQVLGGRLNLNHRVEVRDEAGDLVASCCFGDVVEVVRS